MRFIVLVKASSESESGALPDKEMFAKMETFNEELEQAGVMLSGEGLHPSSKGARIQFRGDEQIVSRGPFGGHDLVAGFWIIEAKSLDDAITWMRRAPFPAGELEIRPLQEIDDFASISPDVVKREKALQAKLAKRSAVH